MSGTRRSSARLAANASSSPKSAPDASSAVPGDKRKGGSSTGPKSKKNKKSEEKEQISIEQSMGKDEDQEESKDVDMKDEEVANAENDAAQTSEDHLGSTVEQLKDDSAEKPKANGDSHASWDASHAASNEATPEQEDIAVEKSSQREDAMPSSILEKGLIYFFFRARVNVNDPSSSDDIARSYMVLRPMPRGSKLGDGPIGDTGNNRLLALPKKVLPKSPRDRFMTFVEKANASMEDIKSSLAASDYATKTAGTSHAPAVNRSHLY